MGLFSKKKKRGQPTALDKGLSAAAKAAAGAGVGAANGVVAEAYGDEIATYVQWAGVVAGGAGLVLLDEKDSPFLHAASRTMLTGSATLIGERAGRELVKGWRAFREEEDQAGLSAAEVDKLRAELEASRQEIAAARRAGLLGDLGDEPGERAVNGTGEPMKVTVPAQKSAG